MMHVLGAPLCLGIRVQIFLRFHPLIRCVGNRGKEMRFVIGIIALIVLGTGSSVCGQ
jgi:hypothetical protein